MRTDLTSGAIILDVQAVEVSQGYKTKSSIMLRRSLATLLLVAHCIKGNDDAYFRNDDAYFASGAYSNQTDDGVAGDDAYAYYDVYGGDDGVVSSDDDAGAAAAGDDDNIADWTDFSVFPRRCINYNGEDMIMFSTYDYGYDQCGDRPIATYVVSVTTYVAAYLDQLKAAGNDFEVSEESLESLECTTLKDVVQVPFKNCQSCAIAEDGADVNESPLCEALWDEKYKCNRDCQKIGHTMARLHAWSTADRVLLLVLTLFGVSMLVGIVNKRRGMTHKETLLEEAAINAAGLEQSHIIGVFLAGIFVVIIFGMLRLKHITWFLIILLDGSLFAYLMKLTVSSGMHINLPSSETVAVGRTRLADEGA